MVVAETVDQKNNEANKLPQYIAALTACMGAFAAGGVLGWTANISEDMKKFTYNNIDIDEEKLGWIGSLATLGAAFSCFPIAFICNLVGRKSAMMYLTLPFLLGWLLIIFAKWLWMIYIGRFLTGMAGCAFFVAAPIYISESVEKTIRGALASYFELLSNSGILVAYVLGMYLDMNVYTIIIGILPLLFAVTFVFQPESPLYLISKNRDDEARKVLTRLRGTYYDVDMEFDEIKNGLVTGKENQVRFSESIKKKSARKAAFICCMLMILQQLGGINVIVFYSSTVFASTGVDIDEKVSTIIFGALQMFATFLSTTVVDRLGRRVLLMISNLGAGIAVATLAVFYTLQEQNVLDGDMLSKLRFLPLITLSLYIVSFSLGMNPLPWVLSAELFPPEINSFGCALAGVISWFFAFLVTKFYFDIKTAIGNDVTFYIFSGVLLLTVGFVYIFVPETKGKTLAEIQKELNE